MKKEQERILSKQEEERLQQFNEVVQKYESEGYQAKMHTEDIVKANIYAILLWLPFGIISLIGYRLIRRPDLSFDSGFPWMMLAVAYLIAIPLHEWIHGLTFGAFAGRDAISYGIMKDSGTPYCSCSKPMKKWQYILGAMMPAIILGFIPMIIGICIHNGWLLVFANFMILSGGGDMLMSIEFLRTPSKPSSVFMDHPTELGFLELTKEPE